MTAAAAAAVNPLLYPQPRSPQTDVPLRVDNAPPVQGIFDNVRAHLANWWTTGSESKLLLDTFKVPNIGSTAACEECATELEKMNERREPWLTRLKELLKHSTIPEIDKNKYSLISLFQKAWTVRQNSQKILDAYPFATPATRENEKAHQENYKIALAKFTELNLSHQSVYQLFKTKLTDLATANNYDPAQLNELLGKLKPPSSSSSREESIAMKTVQFVTNHPIATLGLAAGVVSFLVRPGSIVAVLNGRIGRSWVPSGMKGSFHGVFPPL